MIKPIYIDELQDEYSLKSSNFNKNKIVLLKNVTKFKKEIESKKFNTTELLKLDAKIDTELFITSIGEANIYINRHNEKTKNFTEAKKVAATILEEHYLSEIYDEVKKLGLDISTLNGEIHFLEKGDSENAGIEEIEKRIIGNKNRVSTSGTACAEINKQLKTFLGRDELTFEVDKEGYVIRRKEKNR